MQGFFMALCSGIEARNLEPGTQQSPHLAGFVLPHKKPYYLLSGVATGAAGVAGAASSAAALLDSA
jgi:hypothetical protein